MLFDLPPDPPKFWLPPKPAIIRQATPDLVVPRREPLSRKRRRAGDKALEFSLVDHTTATSGATIAISGSANEHDFALLFDGNQIASSGANVPVTPSGWIEIVTTSGGSSFTYGHTRISYRVLTSGQAGTNVTGFNIGGNEGAKVMMVFRPSKPITSITLSTWNSEFTSGNPALQTVSAAGQPSPLLVFGCAGTGSAINFSTETPAFDDEYVATSSFSFSVRAGFKIYNSTPADHSIDIGDSGNPNMLLSGYVRFT